MRAGTFWVILRITDLRHWTSSVSYYLHANCAYQWCWFITQTLSPFLKHHLNRHPPSTEGDCDDSREDPPLYCIHYDTVAYTGSAVLPQSELVTDWQKTLTHNEVKECDLLKVLGLLFIIIVWKEVTDVGQLMNITDEQHFTALHWSKLKWRAGTLLPASLQHLTHLRLWFPLQCIHDRRLAIIRIYGPIGHKTPTYIVLGGLTL